MVSFSDLSHCPACGTLWHEQPIPPKSRWLFGDSKFFSRVIAISSWRQDRCVAYQCPDCHTCWDRDSQEVIEPYDLSLVP